MAMEFGWWDKSPEEGKFQICVRIHGGKAEWTRKQGHHTSWETHPPTEKDWDKLHDEASRRVPRRLISPKQFAEIETLRNKPVFISKPSRPGPSR